MGYIAENNVQIQAVSVNTHPGVSVEACGTVAQLFVIDIKLHHTMMHILLTLIALV
jgi:hypothetical protein